MRSYYDEPLAGMVLKWGILEEDELRRRLEDVGAGYADARELWRALESKNKRMMEVCKPEAPCEIMNRYASEIDVMYYAYCTLTRMLSEVS